MNPFRRLHQGKNILWLSGLVVLLAVARIRNADPVVAAPSPQGSPSAIAGKGSKAKPAPMETDLHKAARAGDAALLQTRLKQGADPNARDAEGRTALMDAVAAGKLEIVRLLLSARTDVNARSNAGRTALIEAAADGQLEAARLLIADGADLNVYQRGWGTALRTAERAGHNDIAAMLLQAGAQPSGSSVGDMVCVRPWRGEGYCGTVQTIDKNHYQIRVTQIIGCRNGCPSGPECSAGRPVGGSGGISVGDEVNTVSWCLTHTGVKP
jgi:uncharacterized protein